MVDVAKFFMEFCMDESCGKCVPCRVGTVQMVRILERITDGSAGYEDQENLKELCTMVKDTSLCGLGQSAPNPVLSTMRYFIDEYEAHIQHNNCPAGVCSLDGVPPYMATAVGGAPEITGRSAGDAAGAVEEVLWSATGRPPMAHKASGILPAST